MVRAGAIKIATVIIVTVAAVVTESSGMPMTRDIEMGCTRVRATVNEARTITRNGHATIAAEPMATMVRTAVIATASGIGRRSARASYVDMTKATGAMETIGGAESSVDDSRSRVDC